jgi:hypothetical protein
LIIASTIIQLKIAQAIKQMELAKRRNEFALWKAAGGREVVEAEVEASHYGKGTETVYLNATAMQNSAKAKREYELKTIVLAEPERLETTKREPNEGKIVADKYTIMQEIYN